MLFLLFQIDRDRYALDIRQVVEVLPQVQIAPMTGLPVAVAGVINYRGSAVPAIDLCQLLLRRPARKRYSTRLIIVHYLDRNGTQHPLGLIAEQATETVRRDPGDFRPTGIASDHAASHVGGVAIDETGMVQRTDLHQLLPETLRDLLFRPSPAQL